MNSTHALTRIASLTLALTMAACGGGGSAPDPLAPVPAPAPVASPAPPPAPAPAPAEPAPPPAIAGDPAFTAGCTKTPARTAIGPFTTQSGDCFVAIQITTQELADLRADYTRASVRDRVLAAVKANFTDRIDIVMVVVDQSAAEQAAAGPAPFGWNQALQSCSVHNTTCPRFGRLGNLWLSSRDGITQGPLLHELFHGFMVGMTLDQATNFLIPTVTASHWGLSSAGGQIGGWASVTQRADGVWVGTGPADRFGRAAPFSDIANGGNSVPYSNLELWAMGLIPDNELQAVTVAQGPTPVAEAGAFRATGFITFSPTQIVARALPQARPSTSTPRAYRALVVLATTAATVDPATVTLLNQQADYFSRRADPGGSTHNFWTATGKRATLQMGAASDLAK